MRVAWIPLGNVAIMAIVTGAARVVPQVGAVRRTGRGCWSGQDPQASMRGLMKIAGGNHLHEMNVDAFLAEAEEYEAGGDLRDSVLKILNVLPRSHPFTTVAGGRAEEVGGVAGLPADHGRALPAARGGQGHLGPGLLAGVRRTSYARRR
ncbi:hypothetical protein SFUMM280S_01872 [Streptomyces fumanus]